MTACQRRPATRSRSAAWPALLGAVPRAYDDVLDKAGVPHEIVIYPGAPHGFFERHYLNRLAQPGTLADVWQRLTTFFAAPNGA